VQKSGPRVDFQRVQGPSCKITKITQNNELFYKGKILLTGSTRDGPWSCRAVHRGSVVVRTEGHQRVVARSPELASGHSGAWELTGWGTTEGGEHEDPGLGLTRARAAVDRRRDRGDEWWQLELSAREKEGVRELRREQKRDSEGRDCSSPFIGAEGALERGRWGGNGWH
jgi:hypothetical protein